MHLTHHLNSAIKGLNDFKGKLLPVLPASPRAHGVILGTLYLPVAMMLRGLVMRGVAFDFRIKVAAGHKPLWKQAQCWPAAAKAMYWAHASPAFMAPAGPPFSMR